MTGRVWVSLTPTQVEMLLRAAGYLEDAIEAGETNVYTAGQLGALLRGRWALIDARDATDPRTREPSDD